MEYYEGVIPPEKGNKKKKIIVWCAIGILAGGAVVFVVRSANAKDFIKSRSAIIGESLSEALGISHEPDIVENIPYENESGTPYADAADISSTKGSVKSKNSSKKKSTSIAEKGNLNNNNTIKIISKATPSSTAFGAEENGNTNEVNPVDSSSPAAAGPSSSSSASVSAVKKTNTNYEISLSIAGNGRGIVTSTPPGVVCSQTCAWNFSSGEVVKLHATHDSASTFAGWSGACYGKSADCMFTVTGFISLTANFEATNVLGIPGTASATTTQVTSDPSPSTSTVATSSAENPSPESGQVPIDGSSSASSTVDSTSSIASGNALDHLVIADIETVGQSSANDFIKIFNPTASAIDISDWKLHKKSSTGTDYSLKSFPKGSTIESGGYFTWANSENDFADSISADVSSDETLSADNSAALIDASGTIVDEVAWGNGTNQYVEGSPYPTSPAEGQVLTRAAQNGLLIDTDNNAADFSLQ